MTVHPSINQARRAARIRRVVVEVMADRASGKSRPDSEVLGAHPDLLPELRSELAVLAVLERARTASRAGSPDLVLRGAVAPIAPDAFEGYEVRGEVHRGGQGVVYEGSQKSTGRRVAIKVMREGLFGGTRESARFEREVKILGQLEHPGIVGILASGVHAGHFYYVMEFVAGLPLDDYARARCPRIPDRIALFLRVCEAVSAAHLRGIIHRDLKPANILVDERGQPRILDFGLARITADWTLSAGQTYAGQFVGSVPWASPEQAAGDPAHIDLRTDVYSLGVMLYQLLADRFPYEVEGGPREVLDRIMTAEPARFRSASRRVDESLEAITLKCLAKEPERRYQSASELAGDLRRFLEGRPILARHPSLAYMARSFIRRHRPLVAGAAAVLGALVLGLIGTTAGLFQASAGRRIAEHRLAESQRLAYAASIAAADSALGARDAAAARARLADAPESLRGWEWTYLSDRTDDSREIDDAYDVRSLAVLPGGSQLVGLCGDGVLRLLDSRSHEVIWTAEIPGDCRSAFEQLIAGVSPDGRFIATAHGSRALVWDLRAHLPPVTLDDPGTLWGNISAAFRPGTTEVTLTGRQGRLSVWDHARGARIRSDAAHEYSGADYSPDGRVLATLTNDGTLLLEAAGGAPIASTKDGGTLPVGTAGVIRFSPDGRTLAVPDGNDVSLIDVATLSVRAVLKGHSQRVRSLAFSADGSRLAASGYDRVINTWDTSSGALLASLIGHTDVPVGLGFLGGESRIVSGGLDHTIRLWDPVPDPAPPLKAPGRAFSQVSFDAPGQHLLACSTLGSRCWNVGTQTLDSDRLPSQLTDRVITARWDKTGRLLAFASDAVPVAVREVEPGRTLWTASDAAPRLSHLVFSPDARVLAGLDPTNQVRLLDAATGTTLVVCTVPPPPDSTEPAFSPDGRTFLCTSAAGLTVCDTSSGRALATLTDNGQRTEHVRCMSWAPDGRTFATGDGAGEIQIWDASERRVIRRVPGMQPSVWSVAFDPTGTRLAAGSQDRTVRVIDPSTGRELLILRGHTGSVVSLAWSPDGTTLASGSYDGTVRLWGPRERPRRR